MSTSGNPPLNPLSPVANLGNLYISGAQLTYASTTTFTAGIGQVRDSTDSQDIIVGATRYANSVAESGSSATSVPVTVSVAVKGAGGIDVGAVAASTFYYVHAIGDSRGFNAGSVIISLSATAPKLPLGYDSFRRIGGIATNGSSQVRQFVQTGTGTTRRMYYDVPVAPGSAPTTGSTTFTTIGTLVTLVPQISADALIDASLIGNSAGNALYVAPFGAAGNTSIYAQMSSVAVTAAALATLTVPMGLNAGVATVNYRTTSASDTVAFLVQGYIDQL